MDLGCGEDKNHMLGRLLKRFEQRVKSLGGEHMDLVDDINPVAAFCGLELNLVDNLADMLDFAV